MILGLASTGAIAQTAEPTYKGDPSVYKVIFEDANFRVIEANRGPGVKDKAHGHPSPSIVYYLTDCKSKLYAADGKTNETTNKVGTANAVPVIGSHSAENIGTTPCKQVFVEKK
jgi:hypothetical protein